MSVLGEFYDFFTWVKKFSEKKQNAPPEPEGALHFGCTLCSEFVSIILCARRYSIMAYLRKAGIRKSW